MSDDDFGRLSALLDAVSELKQRPHLSSRAKTLFAGALSGYPIEVIENAVLAHLRDVAAGAFTTPLQPAHVVAQIEALHTADARPEADEAWAIALAAFDEMQTVVWTAEIAEAAGVARALLAVGDTTGARLAFRTAYIRLVTAARARREPLRWFPSLGRDRTLQHAALTEAARVGRLTEHHSKRLLAAPVPAGNPLLPGPSSEEISCPAADAQLKRLQALSQDMLNRWRRTRRIHRQKGAR